MKPWERYQSDAADGPWARYQEQKPAQAPYKIGQEGFADAMKQVVEEAGPVGSFLSQAGKTLRNTGEALGIVDKSPEWEALQSANREVNPISSIAGDVAGTAGQAYLGGRALQGAGKVMQAAKATAPVGKALSYLGQGLTTPQTARQAAAAGAAFGAATTPGDLQQRAMASALGAGGGALGYAIPQVLSSAYKTVGNLIRPLTESGRSRIVGNTLASAGGRDALASLESAGQLVPGSAPTVAEVANSGGLAALQRAAAQANPEAFAQRSAEQASARLNALRQIAGDDVAMAAAKELRQATTSPLYKAASKAVVPNTAELASVASRIPQQAIAKAKMLADLEGVPLNNGEGVTGQGLHYVKMALDDMIGGAGQQGIGATEKRALIALQDDLVSLMSKEIPDYGKAMAKYSELSKPINQMQVGQELMDRVAPALSDFGALGKETGARYANALRNAQQTVKSATGRSNATLEGVMTKDQMATLNNIAKDLARKTNAQDLGRGVGSNTYQNLVMNNLIENSGAPRVTGALMNLPGVNRVSRFISEGADQQVKDLLANAMLDPKMAAKLIKQAQAKGLLDRMTPTLSQIGGPVGQVGLLSAFQQ